MPGRVLLDTNIVIALLAAEERVMEAARRASGIYLCSTVVGELHFGAQKSLHVEANLQKIERLLRTVPVLLVDVEVARHYGLIKAHLQKLGRPIPENDIWIAAAARRHGVALATRDPHFEGIEGLDVAEW